MRDAAHGDVLKVWFYAAVSVLGGAWISPLFYNAGKALAEVAEVKQTNGPLEWLADRCRLAGFPDFFEVAILVVALLLFVPFMDLLRGGRAVQGGKVGELRLPDGVRGGLAGQRLVRNPLGMVQAVAGFIGVSGLFFIFAGTLILAGIFELKNPGVSLLKIALRGFAMAWLLALVQEILFRGIAMGVFLRAMRPAAALGLSTLLFALVHMLHAPAGLNVADAEASGVGFELLRKIAGQFSEVRFVLGTFLSLLALGGVLAYARWKTASLWLPVGLHAGWIFINGITASVTVPAMHPDSPFWLLAGNSFHEGLVPLVGILIAGSLITRLTTPDDVPDFPA
ncbi:MAG: CPBP family intramembrane glutamic endopeptidase [Verrucomicrobiota bacterium]